MKQRIGMMLTVLWLLAPWVCGQEGGGDPLLAELRALLDQLEQQPDDAIARQRLDVLLERLESDGGVAREVELKVFEAQTGNLFHGAWQEEHAYDFALQFDPDLGGEQAMTRRLTWLHESESLSEDRVQLSGGDALHGEVTGFSLGELHFEHVGLGSLSLEAPRLEVVRFRSVESQQPAPQQQTVCLVSGERLTGNVATLEGEVLVWHAGLFEDVLEIPRHQVRALELFDCGPFEPSLSGDLVRCLNGDQLSGVVLRIEDQRLQVQPRWAVGALNVPLQELEGIAFATAYVPSPTSETVLALRDGSRLSGQWLSLQQGEIAWKTSWTPEMRIQTSLVEGVYFDMAALATPFGLAELTLPSASNVYAHRAARYVAQDAVEDYVRQIGRDVVYLDGGDRISGVLGASDADRLELQTAWGGLFIERAAVEALTFAAQEPKRKAFLGIRMEDDGAGVRIVQVIEGSPAELAGLREQDRILQLEEHAIVGSDGLRSLLLQFGPGEQIQLGVERSGQTLTLPLQLGARETATGAVQLPPAQLPPSEVRQRVVVRSAMHALRGEYQGLFEGAPVVSCEGERIVYDLSPDNAAGLRLRLAEVAPGTQIRLEFDELGRLWSVQPD